ncbi:hypothetical protein RN001_002036 [Aquatica leii]|uniref:FP protein C-terminal domain-containing protein n=1 Tax=Aquatica leii TaxID=1421715 RepID=A0AAN7SSR7_9COLE|nr:hypothetical protein RN001_002036 [Aquatica leii]
MLRVCNLEKYSRLNSVEIKGVPQIRNENILSVVNNVGRALNYEIKKEMVDACHRLRPDLHRPQEPASIILKFVSRIQKDEFLEARKIKRNFCTRDLDPACVISKPIYINQSLSPDTRKLYAKCREFKKSNNIKYLWIKNGNIMMRKTYNSQKYIINSVADFRNVH